MWESENQDESPLMTTDNFHGIDRLVCGDCHATLYDPCCRSNDLLQRLQYTCADFHSNCHAAPYRSCDSAHFDDHQLHDDLQFAGGQLSNSLSYPRRVVWNSVVWNHDIERYGKYSVFVNLLWHSSHLSNRMRAGFPFAIA